MVEDKMKTLSEKTLGFLNISKQVEEWAGILPDPKAMKLFINGKNLLQEARADLDFMLEMIDATEDLEYPVQLPKESSDELPKESTAESSKESSAELPAESSAELPKKLLDELPTESTAELPKESSTELPKDSAAKSPAELLKESTAEPPKKLSDELPKVSTAELPKESTAELPKKSSDEPPKEPTAELPKESTAELPKKSSDESHKEPTAELPKDSTAQLPTKSTAELPKESSTELPKDSAAKSPAELPKESTAELPKKSSDEPPKEPTAELPKDSTAQLPTKSTAELPKESSTELPKDSAAKSPAELPKESTAELPKKSSDEPPKEPTAELPKDSTAQLPTKSTAELPKESSTELPKDSAAKLPAELPKESTAEPPKKSSDEPPKEPTAELPKDSTAQLPKESSTELPNDSAAKSPAELLKESTAEPPKKLSAELPNGSTAQLPKGSTAELPKESTVQLPQGSPAKSPAELSKESTAELREESWAKAADELSVELALKSNLSTDAPSWNPLVQKVPDSQVIFNSPTYSPKVEFPTPGVPIFYGDPRFWNVFKQAFKNVVHTSPYLSSFDKVEYLVGYMDGDALSLVDSIPLSEKNYGLIWNTLQQKYEDPSTTAIRYDFSPRTHVPSTSLEFFYYLQEVLDYCFIIHNSLSRMNYEPLGDQVLYEIIQAKLDTDMFNQLMMNMNENQIPTFLQISGFLQHHIQKMERMSQEIKKAQLKGQRLPGLITTTLDPKLCKFCKESTHKLFNCKGFLELEPINRYAYVKTNNRCFNCLGERHSVPMCLSENVCALCKKKHHSLLHDEEIEANGYCHMKFPFQNSGESQNISIPIDLGTQESIILATASVTAFGKDDSYTIPARALLDSASQCHLISNRCRIALNLPLLPLDSGLSGVRDIQRGIMGTTIIKFSPYFNDKHTVSVIAYVIDSICYDLPSAQVAPRIKESLARFRLADPNFDIPSRVDLLIGSEIFPVVLKKKQYRVPDSFCYGLETIFGWIMMGRAPGIGPINPKFQSLCSLNAIRHTLRRLNDINEFFYPEKFPELMKELITLEERLKDKETTKSN